MPIDDADRIIRPGFNARVYALVRQIPSGRIATYGDIASALGSPRIARQVGFALAACREDDVPWQRVLNAKAMISVRGDTERGDAQRDLLESEGVVFDVAGRVPLDRLRFRAFETDAG